MRGAEESRPTPPRPALRLRHRPIVPSYRRGLRAVPLRKVRDREEEQRTPLELTQTRSAMTVVLERLCGYLTP